jgi:hypothetical protein
MALPFIAGPQFPRINEDRNGLDVLRQEARQPRRMRSDCCPQLHGRERRKAEEA